MNKEIFRILNRQIMDKWGSVYDKRILFALKVCTYASLLWIIYVIPSSHAFANRDFNFALFHWHSRWCTNYIFDNPVICIHASTAYLLSFCNACVTLISCFFNLRTTMKRKPLLSMRSQGTCMPLRHNDSIHTCRQIDTSEKSKYSFIDSICTTHTQPPSRSRKEV